ncbi:MAG: integrase arm-type DNA-binding domain-containing protein [Pseudomonadota bacterium]|nr:integrase arm-type DNA-binding domain-containing protein [Pseudomonadota bacterium]
MSKLTAMQIKSLLNQPPKKHADGGGLYFCVRPSGSPYWMLRYSNQGKRREVTLGQYPQMTLAQAREDAVMAKQGLRQGSDPIQEKAKLALPELNTVSELFHDWYDSDLSKRLKHPNIPERIFRKEIAPIIGKYAIGDVSPRDIRAVLQKVQSSDRPTIANDTLMYMKQLFRHGIKLDLIQTNPASPFSLSDAGGEERSRERTLSLEELTHAFQVFHENINSFGRDNHLACCLFLVLGVRKSELCEARWDEFDLNAGIWNLSKERSKTGAAITIPLPTQAIRWLEILYGHACGAPYVFPARRASKRPHMGPDTLNRAISKLFGRETGRKKQPPNKMGGLEHFTVHDLRRTFRSLAAAEGVPGHVAERCLNHKLKGVEGIYDRYDYFEERKLAHQKVADRIEPVIRL